MGLAALVALAPSAASATGASTWSTPAFFAENTVEGSEPDLLHDSGTTYAIWMDVDGGEQRIRTATSTDAGLTWSSAVTLASGATVGMLPKIVSHGAGITAVWTRVVGGFSIVETAFTLDQGLTWSDPVALSATGVDAQAPLLVSPEGSLTVVWSSITSAELGVSDLSIEVLARSSTDGGTSWEPSSMLTTPGSVTSTLRAAGSGDTISVVWQSFGGGSSFVETSSSSDKGVTWSSPVTLGGAGAALALPAVVADDDRIMILWAPRDGTTFSIVARTSTDGGTTWTTPDVISTGATSGLVSVNLRLTRAGTTLMATWVREREDGRPKVDVSTSDDGGDTWSAPLVPFGSENDDYEGAPLVVSVGTTLVAFWVSENAVLSSMSNDGGDTWGESPVAFAIGGSGSRYTVGGSSLNPLLHFATDGSTITAMWTRGDDPTTIMVSTFGPTAEENGGTGAQEPELAATGPAATSLWAALAAALLVGGALFLQPRLRRATDAR
ncbi:MAG: sialidase family protein [Microcella sp.]